MNHFVIIVPVYNAVSYIERCLLSATQQTYSNYTLAIMDDASTDGTSEIASRMHGIDTYHRNENRIGSPLASIVKGIRHACSSPEDIIVTLDGDDWLSDSEVLSHLNQIYDDKSVWMTYGSFLPVSGTYGKYGEQVPNTRTYRITPNFWVTSHLRSFKKKLWNRINDADMRDERGNYFKAAGDAAFMYPMIEMCGDIHAKFVDRVMYIYNDMNALCETRIKKDEQTHNASLIKSRPIYHALGEL